MVDTSIRTRFGTQFHQSEKEREREREREKEREYLLVFLVAVGLTSR